MQRVDWLIVLLYLVLSMGVGLYLSRKASRSLVDFFVSGRSLPWWLAGTSMAATTSPGRERTRIPYQSNRVK